MGCTKGLLSNARISALHGDDHGNLGGVINDVPTQPQAASLPPSIPEISSSHKTNIAAVICLIAASPRDSFVHPSSAVPKEIARAVRQPGHGDSELKLSFG